MRKTVLFFVGLMILLAAGAIAYRAHLISELRKPLLAQLSDPDSAIFRNERVFGRWTLSTTLYCGEINAKNRMGGYVGYRWFSGDSESASIEDDAFKKAQDEAGAIRCEYEPGPDVKWWWLRW